MRKVCIASVCRTPLGKMGGALASVSAVDLGALVMRESLKRAGIEAKSVDHVYMGCVIQVGPGKNVARQANRKKARKKDRRRVL